MNTVRYITILCSLIMMAISALAQPAQYTIANTHAHNDYEHPIPFYTAYHAGFGSIEVDVFLRNGQLLVAHDSTNIRPDRTIESLYLDPLTQMVQKNNGTVYKDTARKLILLIDLKNEAVASLAALVRIMKSYTELTYSTGLQLVITGNQPPIDTYTSYPAYLYFDGNLKNNYSPEAQQRIALYSDNFRNYSKWNGRGIPVQAERTRIIQAAEAVHKLGKPIRFWAAPDLPNAWYQLMRYKVDYINTDKIPEMASFLNKLPKNTYTAISQQPVYSPKYTVDNTATPVKNVILLIGDGMGLAHIYAAYTANKGQLNILNMRSMGLSKTDAADTYITDSGAGGTAMATGQKTNNRFIGVDNTGAAMTQMPTLLKRRGKVSGIITTGDVTDATPAAFYAHFPERDSSLAIAKFFSRSSVEVLMGAGRKNFALEADSSENVLRRNGAAVYFNINQVPKLSSRALVLDPAAYLTMEMGRGDFLKQAITLSLDRLSQNKKGFFLMAEGAKIDAGGHYNNMTTVVTELLDFDKAVGQAMQYADAHPGTLVVVTADHETGGLTLMDGALNDGMVSGNFSTEDHTAIPVPVFAYGPRSGLFKGYYNNTEIFKKILQLLQ